MSDLKVPLFPVTGSVRREARAALKGQRPCCIWLTGLSGSGKSSLANALELALHRERVHSFLLDGDLVRGGLCSDLDMSPEGRRENIRRLAQAARLMTEAGLVVIVAAISPFRAERDAARALFPADEFLSVYLSTPLRTCAERDPKGLYKAAREGRLRNFTGIDSPYEPPLDADFEVDATDTSTDEACRRLLGLVLQRCRPGPA